MNTEEIIEQAQDLVKQLRGRINGGPDRPARRRGEDSLSS